MLVRHSKPIGRKIQAGRFVKSNPFKRVPSVKEVRVIVNEHVSHAPVVLVDVFRSKLIRKQFFFKGTTFCIVQPLEAPCAGTDVKGFDPALRIHEDSGMGDLNIWNAVRFTRTVSYLHGFEAIFEFRRVRIRIPSEC